MKPGRVCHPCRAFFVSARCRVPGAAVTNPSRISTLAGRSVWRARPSAGKGITVRTGLRWFRDVVLLLVLALAAATAAAQTGAVPAGGGGASAENGGRPDYAALADMLEDKQAREQLIGELRRLARKQQDEGGSQGGEEGESGAIAPDSPVARIRSLPQRVASVTEAAVHGVIERVSSAATAVAAAAAALWRPGRDYGELLRGVLPFAGLVVATFVIFSVLRRLAAPLYRRVASWAAAGYRRHPGRALTGVVVGVVVDALTIVAAAVAAYVIALSLPGGGTRLPHWAALFVNAFIVVEGLRVVVRAVLSPRFDGLRPVPLATEQARYVYVRAGRVIAWLGYGLLLALPLANRHATVAETERTVGLVVMAVGYMYVLVLVFRHRRSVGGVIQRAAAHARTGPGRALLGGLARTWHLIAAVYATVLFVGGQVDPAGTLAFVVRATGMSLAMALAGLLAADGLGRLKRRHIRLPEDWQRRMPMLEHRLNAYVPAMVSAARGVVTFIVALGVLDAWSVMDIGAWFDSPFGLAVIQVAVRVAITLLIAAAVWVAIASVIEHRMSPETGTGEPSAREKTLLALFSNAAVIAIVAMTVMITLSQIGINIGPLLAGAGVLGLAIGFGAQKLVQDIITGVFIQLENAMNTGDVVTISGVTGTVEKLTVRSVGVRDLAGTYHLIPFSSVDNVANYMRGFAYHMGEYGIAYREDIDEAIASLRSAFEELRSDATLGPEILEDVEIDGVTALADSSVNIRVRIRTTPGNQWAVGRAYNRLVKRHFDHAGIEIPFPHMTMYFGQDKDGSAPPANVVLGETSTVTRRDTRQDTPAENRPEDLGTSTSGPDAPGDGR